MRQNIVKVELGKICDYSKGKKPKVLTKEYSEKTPFPYINIKAFEYGVFDEYTDGDKCNLCENGDLLMVWDGARAGFIGKAKKGAVGSTLMKIEAKKGIEKDYLFYFLLSLYKKINTNPRGVGIPHVEPSLLWTSELIIRSIPEQRAIVQKIENYFELLDKGIADLKTAQEQLKVYRQAVLKKAFEGGYPSVTIDAISFSRGGYAFKSSDFKETGEYQVIKIGNIRPGILRLNESPAFVNNPGKIVLEKYLLKINDIVITLTGTRKKRDYGYTAIVNKPNLLLNQRVAYLRFSEKCISKYFLYYSWTEPFKEQFFGSETGNVGQGNVGMKSIQKTIMPLPSINQQKQIIKEIESRLSVCDKVEQSISESLEKAEALRQSILKKAFEGKLLSQEEITKCKQEADYEPASVLLERIRKENKHGK